MVPVLAKVDRADIQNGCFVKKTRRKHDKVHQAFLDYTIDFFRIVTKVPSYIDTNKWKIFQ